MQGVISQDEFDVVDSEVRSKEANLKQARVKLARMEAMVTNNRAKINLALAKKDLEMSASMPMKNMAPMTAPVEVQPDRQPGRFKADTYLSMKGDWTITAQVKDPKNKGKQEFTVKVQ